MTKDVDLDLEYMYAAGKKHIPDTADRLAAVAAHLHQHLQVFDQQAALAGDPAVMRTMLRVGGEVYDVLRGGVTSLNNCALAVIATAEDFVRTDEDARDDYRRMDATLDGQSLKDLPTPGPAEPPPPLENPEAPGADLPDGTPWHPGLPGDVPTTPEPQSPEADRRERED